MLAVRVIGFDPVVTRCRSVLCISLNQHLVHRIRSTAYHGSTFAENFLLFDCMCIVGMWDQLSHSVQGILLLNIALKATFSQSHSIQKRAVTNPGPSGWTSIGCYTSVLCGILSSLSDDKVLPSILCCFL